MFLTHVEKSLTDLMTTGEMISPWRFESVFKDLLLLEDVVSRFKDDVGGVKERVAGLFGRVVCGSGPSEVVVLMMRIGILHGIPLAAGMM